MYKRLLSAWKAVRNGVWRTPDGERAEAGPVAHFQPSKESTEHVISGAIARRDGIAETFVESAHLGYIRLKPAPKIGTDSDAIGSRNLVDDVLDDQKRKITQNLLDKLEQSEREYFEFAIHLFKFNNRRDRSVWNLLKHPQTYADLEEENIEEKFPADLESRALICALNNVIKHNQWSHIIKKRLLQIIFSAPVAIIFVLWPRLVEYLQSALPEFHLDLVALDVTTRDAATAAWIGIVLAYVWLARLPMRYLLEHLMQMFEAVNATSCLVLSNHMTGLGARIGALFNKLLVGDIALSQGNFESVQRADWPARVEKVFNLALWEAKRVEYLERFWQIRLERLRLFEIVSDEIGNMSSRTIALAIIGITMATSYALWERFEIFHFATIAFIGSLWYFGQLTRRPRYSFGMDAIARQGFESGWEGFSKIRYYYSIGRQYRGAKAQIRTDMLEGHFPGGAGTQRPPRGE